MMASRLILSSYFISIFMISLSFLQIGTHVDVFLFFRSNLILAWARPKIIIPILRTYQQETVTMASCHMHWLIYRHISLERIKKFENITSLGWDSSFHLELYHYDWLLFTPNERDIVIFEGLRTFAFKAEQNLSIEEIRYKWYRKKGRKWSNRHKAQNDMALCIRGFAARGLNPCRPALWDSRGLK